MTARLRAYWYCQIGGWLSYAVANVAISVSLQGVTLRAVLPNVLVSVVGLGLTHLFRGSVKKRAWSRQPLRILIPKIFASSIVLALLIMGIVGSFNAVVFPQNAFSPGLVLVVLFNLSATFLLWSLIYFGLHYWWHYQQAEREKWQLEVAVKEAELRALKAQMNPHFLFNSLNSIRALITENPDRAKESVTQLARLLRAALQTQSTTTAPLSAELETVETYLALERIRLEERLAVTIAVEAAVATVPVPTLLLQTLVENAIKHGIATRPEGGKLEITAHRNGEAVYLRVTNVGHFQPTALAAGIGLQNARERLTLLFGDRATLEVRNAPADKVVAEVRLPLPANSGV